MGLDLRPAEPATRRGYWTVGVMAIIAWKIKLIMDNILLKTIIPLFHYSIIPRLRQKLRLQKISNIFI
jgi:hypothetical protein